MSSYSETLPTEHIARLFPIHRSLTGPGINESFKYFIEFFDEFSLISFKSGEQVFDWIIPVTWSAREAYIEHLETNTRYAVLQESNLHLVGYSEAVDMVMDLSEFRHRIYTIPEKPNSVPYVTSYYERNWGFCLSQNTLTSMPDGKYRVFIDTTLEDGNLDVMHAVIEGEFSDEVLFASYLCHPSMVNNELSGPVVLGYVLEYLKERRVKSKYTYRFVLAPETIGTVAYLSRYATHLRDRVACGFVVTCVGDDRAYSFVKTPKENTLADHAIRAALIGFENVIEYSFLDRGSDERQYCSPRINIPVCTFCRSKFGTYSEYHTNDDNISITSDDAIRQSASVLISIIEAIETCLYPLILTTCEPQLGRRGLYPNISTVTSFEKVRYRSDILAYSDGKTDIFSMAILLDIPLDLVVAEIRVLIRNSLIQPLWKRTST